MKNEYLLKYDFIFKTIFKNKNNLRKLLEEVLLLKVKNVEFVDTEMRIENKHEKKKILDLIVYTEKGIVNVEVNNGYKPGLDNRNFIYFCKLVGSTIEKTDDYIDMPNHIQLNLTWNLNKYVDYDVSNQEKLVYYVTEENTGKRLTNSFKIVIYNMDYYERKCYNDNINETNKFMLLLAAPSIEVMKKISQGDKVMEEIANKVYELNYDPDIAKKIAIENDEEKLFNSAMIVARREGIAVGKTEGIAEGKNEREIEIALKMLELNSDINFISEVTGLSLDEIKNLK